MVIVMVKVMILSIPLFESRDVPFFVPYIFSPSQAISSPLRQKKTANQPTPCIPPYHLSMPT